MNPRSDAQQVNAFVDGELDLSSQLAMEQRLGDDAALQRQVEPRLRLLRELDAPRSAQAPAELNVAIHRALAGRRQEAQSHLDAALRLRPELSAQARSESWLEGLVVPG